MIAPARLAAFNILMAVSAGRADLPATLALSRTTLRDERDQALAADIAIGVQRWRAALDYLIVHFTKRAFDRMDGEVIEILRLSAYQLLHLSRVPASAVVDDAVNLTGRAGKASARGLVNAVLRQISRHRNRLPLPARPSNEADRTAVLNYLSITLSHPLWLVERWYRRLGFAAAESWLRFNNTPASVTLRVNTLKTTAAELSQRLAREGIVVRSATFAPDALIVEDGNPLRTTLLQEGWFVVQDEASQLVPLLAGDNLGSRVLDACAAPGGKTVALSAAMRNRGALVACDVRSKRMTLLRNTITAAGATNVRLVQADLTGALPFTGPFDCVVVDAPCSGLGTLRRDPDIRWRRGERDLAPLAIAELTMLRHAADLVAPGGRLVYATCSSEPEENEDVVDAFLSSAPAFTSLNLRTAHSSLPRAVVDDRGHLRTAPHLHGLEAFFGAVLVRGKL
jgi:16S rRNA (cytosine967-C5)-methyltransferase